MMQKGKIYVASMNMRGKWAIPLGNNALKVNVTSAQAKKSRNRIDFSPMTEIPGGYKGYWNFESYWQSGKVFEDIPMETTKKWWLAQKKAKRRYPKSKGKKVLYAVFDDVDGRFDYVDSRKKIYVPKYHDMIKEREMVTHWKNVVENGQDIIIYDFDGPREKDRSVTCVELSQELLVEKINDTRFPFGHGYIVAATIAGIDISMYVK